ncbi:MAG: hypothetical protein IJL74_02490 [Bacilli bacterium]|nr:hypothetical protein [Bacilli bacterium]
MIFHLLINLITTIIIEISVSLIIGIRDIKDLEKIVFINCITNLSLSITVYKLDDFLNFYILYFLIIPLFEVVVFFIEALYFKGLKYKKMNNYKVSLLLNGISYSIGLIYTVLYCLIKF